MKEKPTIEELEDILNREGNSSIEILPNGEIRAVEGVLKLQAENEQLKEEIGELQAQLTKKDKVIRAMAKDVLKESPTVYCLGDSPCPSIRTFPSNNDECLECYIKTITQQAEG